MNDPELKNCVPCGEGTPPLSDTEERALLGRIHGWSLHRKGVHQLRKLFQFPGFEQAVAFVNLVAGLAQEEDHHPDIYLTYRHVTLVLWTKTISGLSENDFILAAKIDVLPLPD
jgi:4a-hydroxytetrahydrobiopterin dehydratase